MGPEPLSSEQLYGVTAMVQANAAASAEFAYIDESGDTGMAGGTATFTLGCVLVPVDLWDARLKMMVSLRRRLRETYRLRLRDEVKANWLVGCKKHFADLKLGDGQLRDIYRQHMRSIGLVASGAFAIVVQKELITKRDIDVFDRTWTYLLERLRKRSEATQTPIIVVHDHGEDAKVRALFRRFRRVNWDYCSRRVEAPLLVEDPVPRDSPHSFFIQLADLAAYAGATKARPSAGRRAKICSAQMWDELGSARATEVSTRRRDGLYVWPTQKGSLPQGEAP